MATEVISTIIPGGGGDYTLLSSWESGEQRNLVTADEIAVAECQAGAITDNVTLTGWTVDATRFTWIRAATGHGHGGLASAGFRVTGNNGVVIQCGMNFCHVSGIVVITSNNHGIFGQFASSDPIVDACVVVGNTSNGATGVAAMGVCRNCIIYDFSGTNGRGITGQTCENNTVINCTLCIGNIETSVKNNIASGSGNDYSGTLNGSATNISADATSPQVGLRNISLTFVDAANDDYHLDATDTAAIGAGTDLSGSFTNDIDGDTRPAGAWDIGADQTADAANELSGSPTAQATDASGTMDAVVSGSGTPQASAATSEGTLQHVAEASGSPQAGAATITGSFGGTVSASGSPQAGAATAAGEAQAPASAAGAPQAGSPTSAGTLMVVVSMSGAPQASPADGFGTADDGQAPLIVPKRKGMIVDIGEILR